MSGEVNLPYTRTFVFDNDHPCVSLEAPEEGGPPRGIYRRRSARGIARVVCYSPRHNLTLAELEPTARGPYCGALGYVGCDGALDSSILIRTITAGRGWWQAPVGGGITARSNPEREYEETWHKAEGLIRALR